MLAKVSDNDNAWSTFHCDKCDKTWRAAQGIYCEFCGWWAIREIEKPALPANSWDD